MATRFESLEKHSTETTRLITRNETTFRLPVFAVHKFLSPQDMQVSNLNYFVCAYIFIPEKE